MRCNSPAWQVDNWEDKTLDFVNRWVAQHAADARAAGKPLIMEEMGKFGLGDGAPERDTYYQAIYDALLAVRGGGRLTSPLRVAACCPWMAWRCPQH